jgi:type I restriction enzyme S subunit
MMTDWEIKKLGDVIQVLDNLRKPITKRDRVEGKYPYYGATGILSYVNDYIFSEKLVLIGEDGAKWLPGDKTSFIVDGNYWVNNHAHVIRPLRKIILDEWIVYFLNFSDLTPFITGMTVPKLNQEKMRGIPIPLPPLPEQKRIVSL